MAHSTTGSRTVTPVRERGIREESLVLTLRPISPSPLPRQEEQQASTSLAPVRQDVPQQATASRQTRSRRQETRISPHVLQQWRHESSQPRPRSEAEMLEESQRRRIQEREANEQYKQSLREMGLDWVKEVHRRRNRNNPFIRFTASASTTSTQPPPQSAGRPAEPTARQNLPPPPPQQQQPADTPIALLPSPPPPPQPPLVIPVVSMPPPPPPPPPQSLPRDVPIDPSAPIQPYRERVTTNTDARPYIPPLYEAFYPPNVNSNPDDLSPTNSPPRSPGLFASLGNAIRSRIPNTIFPSFSPPQTQQVNDTHYDVYEEDEYRPSQSLQTQQSGDFTPGPFNPRLVLPHLFQGQADQYVTRGEYDEGQQQILLNFEHLNSITRTGLQDLQVQNQAAISNAVLELDQQIDNRFLRTERNIRNEVLNQGIDVGILSERIDLQRRDVNNISNRQRDQQARQESLSNATRDTFGHLDALYTHTSRLYNSANEATRSVQALHRGQSEQNRTLQDLISRMDKVQSGMQDIQNDMNDQLFHSVKDDDGSYISAYSGSSSNSSTSTVPASVQLRYGGPGGGDPGDEDPAGSSGGGGNPWSNMPQSINNRSTIISQPYELMNIPLLAVRVLPPEPEVGGVVTLPHMLKRVRKRAITRKGIYTNKKVTRRAMVRKK